MNVSHQLFYDDLLERVCKERREIIGHATKGNRIYQNHPALQAHLGELDERLRFLLNFRSRVVDDIKKRGEEIAVMKYRLAEYLSEMEMITGETNRLKDEFEHDYGIKVTEVTGKPASERQTVLLNIRNDIADTGGETEAVQQSFALLKLSTVMNRRWFLKDEIEHLERTLQCWQRERDKSRKRLQAIDSELIANDMEFGAVVREIGGNDSTIAGAGSGRLTRPGNRFLAERSDIAGPSRPA